ncbi:MAG TPA: hypothetical protein VGK67_23730 [Myxococcales bacterium]|jgi:hypothetical protein
MRSVIATLVLVAMSCFAADGYCQAGQAPKKKGHAAPKVAPAAPTPPPLVPPPPAPVQPEPPAKKNLSEKPEAPPVAGAADAKSSADPDSKTEPWLLLGARVGVVLPQVFNKLGTNFLVDVEAAYQLPFLHRHLGLFFDVGYSQPKTEGTRNDPRVLTNGGEVAYTMTVRDFGLSLGVQYRHPLGDLVVPFVGVGAKMHLTNTLLEQSAGSTNLGTNIERSTRVGFLGRLGLGLHLGPGDLVAEVHLEATAVDHLVTGDKNTSHLALQLGYLFRL